MLPRRPDATGAAFSAFPNIHNKKGGMITQTKVEGAEIGLVGRSPGNAFDISATLAPPPGSPGQRPLSGHGFLCLGDRLAKQDCNPNKD